MQTKKVIKQILTKQIIPTQITKGVDKLLTIEIVTTEPIEYISLIYRTEQLRNEAYKLFDNRVFWTLPFNPIPPLPM